MTWFDFGALMLVLLAMADGAFGGLVWSAVELCLLVLSGLLAHFVAPLATPYLAKIFDLAPQTVPWASHLVVWVFCIALFVGVAVLVQPLTSKCRFTHDRWAGAALGGGVGLLLALLIAALLPWSSPRAYEAELSASHVTTALVGCNAGGLGLLLPVPLGSRLDQLRPTRGRAGDQDPR